MNLENWNGVPRPERITLEGCYVRLEPLDAARHGADLYASAQAPGADDRFRYLFESAPADLAAFTPWLEKAAAGTDPLFFATIDKRTGKAEGRQALMRIDPVHGVIEIGSILWGPAIARSRITTETLYLFASYVFDTLGYRRFEWKCNNLNEPSKRAAERFGFTFEGIFRQHMVAKGLNRDTAWFAMIDADWPRLKAGYERWLSPENFDEAGQQKSKLAFG
ncbi:MULTISPECIES: GNAT family N-acetyltransferase [Rhizobium]|uniref:RimJ/RimL family protein N-acetyltransferase n=1 Tax=Rhizobium paranaense TaxID=1650438 RepID=A0A7W8XYL3_9HYPH|nr:MULTISPECIES: GNAT family protein [Rhizobium]MBB5577749.1 RimJ/RimL family protein N-acetyltransferase [Rhizobium paranaense]PST61713.1 GNAT family N-acetyltransferase [Rhizobium sp. SEMIA4064]